MHTMPFNRIFTLLEPGPVILVTTHDDHGDNVMTISWTMVLGFDGRFAITTGPWNHSYQAMMKTHQCVIAIPPASMIDTIIGIGTCSGADTDKFTKFGLTRHAASHVAAPLIDGCIANIECRVIDVVGQHDIIILEAITAHYDEKQQKAPMLHAVGDGTFIADGKRFDRKIMMQSKLPDGL